MNMNPSSGRASRRPVLYKNLPFPETRPHEAARIVNNRRSRRRCRAPRVTPCYRGEARRSHESRD